jgi:hypothetical protein
VSIYVMGACEHRVHRSAESCMAYFVSLSLAGLMAPRRFQYVLEKVVVCQSFFASSLKAALTQHAPCIRLEPNCKLQRRIRLGIWDFSHLQTAFRCLKVPISCSASSFGVGVSRPTLVVRCICYGNSLQLPGAFTQRRSEAHQHQSLSESSAYQTTYLLIEEGCRKNKFRLTPLLDLNPKPGVCHCT